MHSGTPKASADPATLRRRMLSGLRWTAGTRAPMVLVSAATNVLLARLLTPAELGTYVLLFSAALTAMLVGMLGQQGAVVRFVSEALADRRPGDARRAATASLRLTAIGVALGTAALVLTAGLLPTDAPRAPLAAVVLVAACCLALGLCAVMAEAFRGMHAYGLASVLGPNAYGATLVVALAVLHLAPAADHLVGVLAMCALAAALALALTALAFRRRLMELGPRSDVAPAGLVAVGAPLMLGYLAMYASSQADLWVLGAFRSRDDVAAYASAARVVQQLFAPMLVMTAVVAPLIAELRGANDTARLERLLRRAGAIDLVPATLGLVLALAAGADLLAAIFGEPYRAGAIPLAILCAGLVGQALTGPGLTMLAMAGGQREVMAICSASLAFQLVAGALVVERFGPAGIAATTACGMALQGGLAMLGVRRRWGLWTSPLARRGRATSTPPRAAFPPRTARSSSSSR